MKKVKWKKMCMRRRQKKTKKKKYTHKIKCKAAILMIPFGQTTVYLLYSLLKPETFTHI